MLRDTRLHLDRSAEERNTSRDLQDRYLPDAGVFLRRPHQHHAVQRGVAGVADQEGLQDGSNRRVGTTWADPGGTERRSSVANRSSSAHRGITKAEALQVVGIAVRFSSQHWHAFRPSTGTVFVLELVHFSSYVSISLFFLSFLFLFFLFLKLIKTNLLGIGTKERN